jgi:phospholipase/carboxylesterase
VASSHGGGDLRQMNVREHDLPGDHHVGRYNGMRPLNQQNARAAGPRECQGMEMPKLDCILVEPNIAAERTVIWLHGLGADGHDFEPIVPELHLAPELAVRFVFPNAPSIPVTINGGFVMPAWYDILKMDLERELDVGQLLASAEGVRELIVAENEKGIPSDRILLAGFSQGGAVSYQAALTHPEPLAGLLAISTYFATASSVRVSAANQALPIFVGHGSEDPVVPESLGSSSLESLRALGLDPIYRRYPMGHEVCLEEISDIGSWMRMLFTKETEAS